MPMEAQSSGKVWLSSMLLDAILVVCVLPVDCCSGNRWSLLAFVLSNAGRDPCLVGCQRSDDGAKKNIRASRDSSSTYHFYPRARKTPLPLLQCQQAGQ